MRLKHYFVYILTNVAHTTLYTGVTNHLGRRVFEHKFGSETSFSEKYHVTRLVYYEIFTDVKAAIEREKQIKAGPRKKKIALINSMNSGWEDLFNKLTG